MTPDKLMKEAERIKHLAERFWTHDEDVTPEIAKALRAVHNAAIQGFCRRILGKAEIGK